MIRKLAFALSLLGVGFAGFVHALGLGEATIKSSLNQPLRAEIELVNVGDLQASEILPGLATREEFLKADVERVYFLSDIRFKVVENQSGELVVVLTTTKPVREPFLNFLAEVIWPSGRLLREYALLIDPPLFSEEKQAQPVSAPQQARSEQIRSGDVVSMPSPSRQPVPTASTVSSSPSTYGPTDSQDTLWDIALKARPDRSVSPQQVMLAIQDLNPNAFIDQNINKMKAGQILRLPTKDQIQRRSMSEAINTVIAQNQALQPQKSKPVVSAADREQKPAQSTSGSATGGEDELKLVVADSAQEGTDSASSGTAEEGSGSGGSTEAEKELSLTLEKLDKARIENEDLNARVDDLEEQLEQFQRLLTLKNDQLASVQEQMRESERERQQAAADQADTASVPESEAEAASDGSAADAMEGMDQTPTVAEAPTESAETEAPAEAEEMEQQAAEPETSPAGTPAQAQKDMVEQKAPAQKSDNLIDMVMNNPLYQGLVALGVVVLLVLLWFVSRHNARREEEYHAQYASDDEGETESFTGAEFDEDIEEAVDEADLDEEAEADSLGEEETSTEKESEDVISEANVYIAYGRLDQAATLLEEAISSEPVRTDYRLKLLEVYKDSNDEEAFNRQFSELEAIQDVEALEEANRIRTEMLEQDLTSLDDMEQELNLESSEQTRQSELQEQEASIATEEEAIDQDFESEANKFDFDSVDTDESETEEELDIDLSSEDLDLDLDVELDVDDAKSAESESLDTQTEPAESEPETAEEPQELGASDLELEEDVPAAEGEKDEALGDLDLDDIELSEELDQEKEIDLPEDLSLPEELTEADEDLDAQELEEEPEAPEAPEELKTDSQQEQVVSDDILEEAVEAFGEDDDLESDLGEGEDFDFLEGTDEASTKLDLARAYIDMGDIDGAKDILEEVEKEGNEEQQAEAKDLLGSIDKS